MSQATNDESQLLVSIIKIELWAKSSGLKISTDGATSLKNLKMKALYLDFLGLAMTNFADSLLKRSIEASIKRLKNQLMTRVIAILVMPEFETDVYNPSLKPLIVDQMEFPLKEFTEAAVKQLEKQINTYMLVISEMTSALIKERRSSAHNISTRKIPVTSSE